MATALVAAAAFIAANAATISLAISVIAVGYTAYAAKKARQTTASTQSERKQILRSSTAPKTWLYGENVSSGVLVFAEEQPGSQTEGERLHLVITHAGCVIDRVTDVYINDEISSSFPANAAIFEHYPRGRTTADPYLLSNTNNWDESMVGRDIAWFRTTLRFSATDFPSGVPNITTRKFGRLVLDPRTGTTAYSDNPALCILDYIKNHPSLQYADDEIIMSTFIAGANICDELVDVYDDADNIVGQERRYTLSAEFDLSEEPSIVIDNMLAACGGEPIKVGGMFGIHVGAYYGPTTNTLNQDDIIGPVSIQPEAAREESFNVVRGVYNSRDNRFQETDYPEVRFQEWITEDGDEIVENLDLRYVNSPSQCQRVAAVQAARTRFGMHIEIPCNLRGMNYPPGCSFNLTLDTIGFQSTEFKVVSWRFDLQEGVTLICRRESPDYYDNQNGHQIVLQPLLNIPTGGVPAPTNATYAVELVGEVVQGVISWTNTAFKVATTEVTIRDSANTVVQTVSVPFPGTSISINGRLTGSYTAQLQATGLTGAKSSVATVSFTVAAPAIPDAVSTTASNWNMQLVPTYNAGTIPINTLFEFYYLADTASFLNDPATFDSTDRDQAELIFTGSTFNQGGLTPDRWQHYWVRAINAYGSSPFLYVRAGTTREQDLVTTVVERLQAIEIVSSNFEQGMSGYRLEADGDVEFNNGTFRGALTATSLTLGAGVTIDYGNIDNAPVIRNGNRTFRQASAPGMSDNLEVGDLWIDTDDTNKLYRWSGATWVISRDTGIAQAIQDAADAQAAADGKITSYFQTTQPAINVSNTGDIWFDTDDGNRQYRFNGTAWVVAQDTQIGAAIQAAQTAQTTADGKVVTFYQATAPASNVSNAGDLWVDLDDRNRLYRYSGTAWVDVQDGNIAIIGDRATQALQNAATAQSTADGKIVTFFQNDQPTGGSQGDLWFDTNDSNRQYRHNGTTWVIARDTGIGEAISAAQTAQTTADGKAVTYYQDTAPAANISNAGDLWVDTGSNNRLYRHNGTQWLAISNTGINSLYPNQTNLTIRSSNYQQGTAGWAIDNDGDVEFNGGVFRGTVFVDSLVGDVVSAISKTRDPLVTTGFNTQDWVRTARFDFLQIANARPRARVAQITVRLTQEESTSERRGFGEARIVIVSSLGETYNSRSYIIERQDDNDLPETIRANDVTLTVPVAANTAPRFDIYAEGRRQNPARIFTQIITVSAVTTNNIWTANLITNGGDLS